MQAVEAEKKAQAAQNKAADGPQLEADEADDLDPNQYHERRLRALETTRASGRNPYPHKFKLTMYIPAYVAKYKDIEAGTRQEGQRESLAGDLKSFRNPHPTSACSANVTSVFQGGHKLQQRADLTIYIYPSLTGVGPAWHLCPQCDMLASPVCICPLRLHKLMLTADVTVCLYPLLGRCRVCLAFPSVV